MNMREAPKDRISDLPDSILHHILCFLGIEDGARSSVLSKRWNHIWTTFPTLEIQNCIASSSMSYKFMDFVDGTLHRHNSSNIDKFSLGWHWQLEENALFVQNRVHSWISTVTKRNVKDLKLDLYNQHPWFIPLSLFTSESLTSLMLRARPSIRLPKSISLTKVKRLELCEFEFSDESWNEQLFSNSTVLEELILQHCTYGMRSFCISIPTLKLLKIDDSICIPNGIQDCVLEMDAPKLITFSYSGYVAKEFVLSSFRSLAEAEVCFKFQQNDVVATSQLLRALAHVKCLTVCKETLEAIYSAKNLSHSMLTFHNVKMLIISGNLSTDEGLIALLRAVRNLEALVFEEYMNDETLEIDEDDENDSDEDCSDDAEGDEDEDNDADSVEGENNHSEIERDVAGAAECGSNDESEYNNDSGEDNWALNTETDGCLFPNLKSVCFQELAGNPREMKWVRLILRDAKALETMAIQYRRPYYLRFVNAKSEKELLVEIPKFTRASAGCMFKFWS